METLAGSAAIPQTPHVLGSLNQQSSSNPGQGQVQQQDRSEWQQSQDKTAPHGEDNERTSPAKPARSRGEGGHGGPGRKPRACQECKRQKMKCEAVPGERRCRNCQRRNLECVMKYTASNLSITDVENRYEQKIDTMRSEIQAIQSTLQALLHQNNTPSVQQMLPTPGAHPITTPGSERARSNASEIAHTRQVENTQMAMTRENSLEPEACNEEDERQKAVLVEEPMGSLYEVTRLRNIRSNRAKTARPANRSSEELDDFITREVISEHEAEELYAIFHTSLNHYLWVGLEQLHSSLDSVRRSSEILTATILTVTALHIPTSAETFDKCYKEFLSLISSSMFSRYHSIDDVRALCIAAFWLSDVSWKLSGHAIRIATELNIHQSFYKALQGDSEHFLRARLWYMLYVCDHHFSIAYGRPPMIAESVQIREHERFLQLPFANALDYRILSQVSLMQILTRIHDRFAERRLPQEDPSGALLSEGDFVDMRNFNVEIDRWRMKWHARQQHNSFIGTFPPKGIILYSYFAKLQLNSFAIRGVTLSETSSQLSATSQTVSYSNATPFQTGFREASSSSLGTGTATPTNHRLSTERKEFANTAISAAASILTFVLEEEDMRRALVGTPLYVHTMIAFASVFLLKVTTNWNSAIGLNVETKYVTGLIERMVVLLKGSVTSDRHLLYHIAAGLEKMLERSRQAQARLPRAVWTAAANKIAPSATGWQQRPVTEAGARGGATPVAISEQAQYSPSLTGPSHGNDGLVNSLDLNGFHAPWTSNYDVPSTLDGPTTGTPGTDYGGFLGNNIMIMNDSLIYEAFGSESANDVYNLLTSQFSY
ncbi:hypothetical protein BDV96DRAFT_653023 [Lophiotrema nucula]|uniref:Zn(2)-C6 fungal-type domain-containing protein n=1 Tax=Lophiotrema nucula TaxID=690887 RepID=A0A6A5YP03_9PLEO|nr:hypothetical protein BDV96DRAFT_653023 [Lophiotrema nucula]